MSDRPTPQPTPRREPPATPCPHPPFTWDELCRLVTDMEDGAVSVVICPVCGAFHALVVQDPFQETR